MYLVAYSLTRMRTVPALGSQQLLAHIDAAAEELRREQVGSQHAHALLPDSYGSVRVLTSSRLELRCKCTSTSYLPIDVSMYRCIDLSLAACTSLAAVRKGSVRVPHKRSTAPRPRRHSARLG